MLQWQRDRYRRRDQTVKFRHRDGKDDKPPTSRITQLALPSWKRGGHATMVPMTAQHREADDLLIPEEEREEPIEPFFYDPPMSFYDITEDEPIEDDLDIDPDDAPYDPEWWS